MTYLDVNPMITSLRTTPEDFDMQGSWLRHNPSRHKFRFDANGHVSIRSGCNCTLLAIHPDQEASLTHGFETWRTNFWQPLEINRQFAAHFHYRSWLRRTLIRMTAKLNRWLSQQGADATETMYPAE